jgi:hypothetical protein
MKLCIVIDVSESTSISTIRAAAQTAATLIGGTVRSAYTLTAPTRLTVADKFLRLLGFEPEQINELEPENV